MTDSEEVRDLMAKLMAAVEASLSGSAAVKEALAALVRSGFDPKLFLVANAVVAAEEDEEEAEESAEADAPEPILREWPAPVSSDISPELTKLDRDFLRSVRISTDPSA